MRAAVGPPLQALRGGLRGLGDSFVDLIRRDSTSAAVAALRSEGRGGTVTSVTTADGVRLHVELDGPDDARVAVVFVHGFSLDLTNFRAQRAVLAGQPVRSVHFDQRAFGRSERGSEPASMRLLAADLAEVVETCAGDRPVVLVGHSMGVMVITALAGIRPDLFGGVVAGTVLVAGNAGEITASEFGLGSVLGPVMQLAGLRTIQALGHVPHSADLAPHGFWMGVAGTFMCDATASAATLRVCAALISQNSFELLAEYGEAMYAHDEVASLPVLGLADCVVLAADHDRFIPARLSEELAAGIPGARLVVVPDSGHMIPLEHPTVVTAAIEAMVADIHRSLTATTTGPSKGQDLLG